MSMRNESTVWAALSRYLEMERPANKAITIGIDRSPFNDLLRMRAAFQAYSVTVIDPEVAMSPRGAERLLDFVEDARRKLETNVARYAALTALQTCPRDQLIANGVTVVERNGKRWTVTKVDRKAGTATLTCDGTSLDVAIESCLQFIERGIWTVD